MKHKEAMEKRYTRSDPFERSLWHGTSSDAVEKINVNGFNRSFFGKHGL